MSLDVKAIATNPWVWGGAVALLAVTALTRGTSSAVDSGSPLGLNGVQAAMNSAALAYSSNMAQIAAGTARDNNATNLARDLKTIDAIVSLNEINSTIEAANNESAAGVMKARIAADTSLAIDRNTNETRREMIYRAADVSKFQSQLAASVATANTKAALQAQTQANKINGDNATLSAIFDFAKFLGGTLIPFVL